MGERSGVSFMLSSHVLIKNCSSLGPFSPHVS